MKADQEDELCLFVSEVSRGGKAEEKGSSLLYTQSDLQSHL